MRMTPKITLRMGDVVWVKLNGRCLVLEASPCYPVVTLNESKGRVVVHRTQVTSLIFTMEIVDHYYSRGGAFYVVVALKQHIKKGEPETPNPQVSVFWGDGQLPASSESTQCLYIQAWEQWLREEKENESKQLSTH